MTLTNLFKKRTLIALLGASLLTACGGDKSAAQNDNTPPPTTDTPTKVLRVATEGAFPPYNFTNPDGTLAGFDIDIANGICDKMQVKCEIIAQDWDGIIPSLKAGKYDAIVAAMAVTEERKAQIDFSEPYYSTPLVFVAKKDSSFDPSNPNDILNNTITAQRGTISVDWLEKNHPKAKLQLQDTLTNSFLDLSAERTTAILVDKVAAVSWLQSDEGKNFAVKGQEISTDDNIAVAVDKGNAELLTKINDALTAMKADGTYDAILKKNNF